MHQACLDPDAGRRQNVGLDAKDGDVLRFWIVWRTAESSVGDSSDEVPADKANGFLSPTGAFCRAKRKRQSFHMRAEANTHTPHTPLEPTPA